MRGPPRGVWGRHVAPLLPAGVVDVEIVRGARARPDAPPDLLVEVPHGADRRAHYDALRARLRGDLPADLHAFFHVNTDVGAWQLGRRSRRSWSPQNPPVRR